MKSCLTLPGNYRESFCLNLQTDKKTALLVNGLALALMVVLLIPGFFITPVMLLFRNGPLPFLALCFGTVIYFFLHELVHGLFMRLFSGQRPRYGFTGLYACAGSTACFCRRHYRIIAMAPVVIWGIILAVLSALTVGTPWFWVFYFIEVSNLSGAAGDLYVTCRFSRLPEDILVQDSGVEMRVFLPG